MGNTVHMEYSPAETQPISDTIQWHNSYKTTNQLPFPVIVLKPVAVMQWHRCYIYRDITLPIWYHSLSGLRGGVVGSWTGTYYSHLMGVIHLIFQHNSQCFEEPIIPKIMLA